MLRGIRGATTVDHNTQEDILDRTCELLKVIIERNSIEKDNIAGIIFTATKDIDAVYPARGARMMGFTDVPLMCLSEMEVLGSLGMCIRVLIQLNTEKKNSELIHVYLRGAKVLRPDLNT